MRVFLLLVALLCAPMPVQAQPVQRVAPEAMRRVAPALADYTDRTLFGDVWKRLGLPPRDRSLVTVATLIATGKSASFRGISDARLTTG